MSIFTSERVSQQPSSGRSSESDILNSLIPSSYIHALECFVYAKKEFLSQAELEPGSSNSLSSLYNYQQRYVAALLKQLPPGTAFPAASQLVNIRPPAIIKSVPIRQGPFLLQPAPRDLEGSEAVDATDISYLTFGSKEEDENEDETVRLGVVLVAFKDGKVDLCLDVEKVEAKWEHRGVRLYHFTMSLTSTNCFLQTANNDLPMLSVYETIDLGIISTLSKASSLDLLQGNHPVFLPDPIQDETVYVYHAFGVHVLQLGRLLRRLAAALRDDTNSDGDDDHLVELLQTTGPTQVQPILTTFSVEHRYGCQTPVHCTSLLI